MTSLPNSRGEGFEGPERRACDRLSPKGNSPIALISGRKSLACRIRDVSLSGVQLVYQGEAPPLGAVTLDHEMAGRIAGRAVWRDRTRVGIRLCEPGTELERALQCLNMINAGH